MTAFVSKIEISNSRGILLQRLWLFYLALLQLNQHSWEPNLALGTCSFYTGAPGGLLVRLFKEFLVRPVLWLGEKLSLIQLESPSFPSMQSDCSLHSLSLPDQPRDIKLSKRPLDSIVTNEGPSKRSYVASSSKQPPESRVFLQLIPSFNALRTTVFAANKSTISPLPTNGSLYSAKNSIMLQPFSNHIFPVLTTFNKSDRHFATLHLIRPRLFTFSCYHCFQISRMNTSIPVLPTIHYHTYSAFCRFVQHAVRPSNFESTDQSSPSPTTEPHPAYPLLQKDLANIRREKRLHKWVATGFVDSEVLKNLHIHRLKSTNPDQHARNVTRGYLYQFPIVDSRSPH